MLKPSISPSRPELSSHSIAIDAFPQQSLTQSVRGAPLQTARPVAEKVPATGEERLSRGTKILADQFDLKAIDAVLKLTEGRGGSFTADSPIPGYRRSGREPQRIDIRNHSGRPMLARPTAEVKCVDDSFWVPHRKRLKALKVKRGQLSFQRDIWPILLQAAAELVTKAGASTKPADVEHWYRGWSRYQMDAIAARRALLQSLGVAMGLRPVDTPFAVGETWRILSSQVDELVSSSGADIDHLDTYADVCEEMQRIAFGPSAAVTAKLVSLMRARVVSIGPAVETTEQYDACVK